MSTFAVTTPVSTNVWRSRLRTTHRKDVRLVARCAAAPATDAQFMFHVGNTSFAIPLSRHSATQLSSAIHSAMRTLAEKQKAERLKRWEAMEFTLNGSDGEVDLLEVYCNPNAHTSAFDAKVLITVVNKGMRVTTEGSLTAFKSDVDVFLEQDAAKK